MNCLKNSVYKQASQLRKDHDFSSIGLYSTESVFSYLRHSDDINIVFAMNIDQEEQQVNLGDLLLEMGIETSTGRVLIRSSGKLNRITTMEII